MVSRIVGVNPCFALPAPMTPPNDHQNRTRGPVRVVPLGKNACPPGKGAYQATKRTKDFSWLFDPKLSLIASSLSVPVGGRLMISNWKHEN